MVTKKKKNAADEREYSLHRPPSPLVTPQYALFNYCYTYIFINLLMHFIVP